MAENAQPIIIKKVKKGGHGGHHGGSWKVAYADFVTAMMAFFLLLWLLSASNQETLAGISDYFENPSAIDASGGKSTSMIDLGSNVDISKGDDNQNRESNSFEYYSDAFQQMEQQKLEELKVQLEQVIEKTPALEKYKDQLLIDVTDEGLHIQIVDKKNRPMFDLGSATLKPYAKHILREIAPVLNQVTNKLSISGHTDAKRYFRSDGYSNWELSSDRANAARRELLKASTPARKIARVVGLASKFLLKKSTPSDPQNRRISILLLKKKSEHALYREQGLNPDISSELIESPIKIKPNIKKPKSSIKPDSAVKKEKSSSVDTKELHEAIRSGTVRRSGAIVRFSGE